MQASRVQACFSADEYYATRSADGSFHIFQVLELRPGAKRFVEKVCFLSENVWDPFACWLKLEAHPVSKHSNARKLLPTKRWRNCIAIMSLGKLPNLEEPVRLRRCG